MEESRRKKMKTKIVGYFLVTLGLGMAWSVYSGYKKDRMEYERLKEDYVRESPFSVYSGEGNPLDSVTEKSRDVESKKTDPPVSGIPVNIIQKDNSANSIPYTPVGRKRADWPALEMQNPDITAWLLIPSLSLSYPVVQGEDNAYYLHRSFYGEENYAGCIFLDARNSPDFQDPFTLVYGHNMRDGSMFGSLRNLSDSADREFVLLLLQDYWIYCRVSSVKTVKIRNDRALFPALPWKACGYFGGESGFCLNMPLNPVVCLITCTNQSEKGERLAVFCEVNDITSYYLLPDNLPNCFTISGF